MSGRSEEEWGLSGLAGRQMDEVVAVFPQEGNSGKENRAGKGFSPPQKINLPGNVLHFPSPTM